MQLTLRAPANMCQKLPSFVADWGTQYMEGPSCLNRDAQAQHAVLKLIVVFTFGGTLIVFRVNKPKCSWYSTDHANALQIKYVDHFANDKFVNRSKKKGDKAGLFLSS